MTNHRFETHLPATKIANTLSFLYLTITCRHSLSPITTSITNDLTTLATMMASSKQMEFRATNTAFLTILICFPIDTVLHLLNRYFSSTMSMILQYYVPQSKTFPPRDFPPVPVEPNDDWVSWDSFFEFPPPRPHHKRVRVKYLEAISENTHPTIEFASQWHRESEASFPRSNLYEMLYWEIVLFLTFSSNSRNIDPSQFVPFPSWRETYLNLCVCVCRRIFRDGCQINITTYWIVRTRHDRR